MMTFTGVDERTDLSKLDQFAYDNSCEFGILWSESPEGRHRYPSFDFITQAIAKLGSRLAVHICGSPARNRALNADGVPEILRRAGRLQVNGPLFQEEVMRFLAVYDRQTIITQHTQHNLHLMMVWGDERHSLLVDNSGGRGIVPDEWKRPRIKKPVGFAGGLGPDTIYEQYPKIQKVMGDGWWVDMESSLRGEDDWFSMDRVQLCIDAWKQATRKASGGL